MNSTEILKEGIIVPLMPFLTETGEYDFDVVEKQVDYYIKNGTAGIFVLTTSGQSADFSLNENKNLASIVKNVTEDKTPLYVGIGRTRKEPEYTKNMLDHTIKIGANAAVVLCLDLDLEEQVKHFKEICFNDFPIIAYSLGSKEKQLKRIEDILTLKPVVGAKITIDTREKENEEYFKRAIETRKPTFMGEDVVLYHGLEMGALGGVNAMANLIPRELTQLYKEFQGGSKTKALEIQERINKILLSTIYYGKDIKGNPIDAGSALKNAMYQVMGFGAPTMKGNRPRYVEENQEIIIKSLIEFGLL